MRIGIGIGIGFGRPPAAAAFSPASLAGFVDSPYSVAAWRGANLFFQNAALSTPAAADGDRVYAGNLWTAPAEDGSRPVLTSLGGGLWALRFVLADFSGFFDTSGTLFSGAATFCFRVKEADAAGYTNDRVVRSGTANALYAGRRTSFGFFNGSTIKNAVGVADALFHTVTIQRAAAGDWRLRIDGVDQGGLAANSNSFGTVGLGRFTGAPSANESFDGDLAGLSCYTADITGGDLTRLETYNTALATN